MRFIPVAALLTQSVDRLIRFEQETLQPVYPHELDFRIDRAPPLLSEQDLGHAARNMHVLGDVAYPDPASGIQTNEFETPADSDVIRARMEPRRLPLDDPFHTIEKLLRFSDLLGHGPIQQLRRAIPARREIRLYARQRRQRILTEQFVVIATQHRDVGRNAEAGELTKIEQLARLAIIRNEDRRLFRQAFQPPQETVLLHKPIRRSFNATVRAADMHGAKETAHFRPILKESAAFNRPVTRGVREVRKAHKTLPGQIVRTRFGDKALVARDERSALQERAIAGPRSVHDDSRNTEIQLSPEFFQQPAQNDAGGSPPVDARHGLTVALAVDQPDLPRRM
ncbi:MAG TPA: hypothetical protein PLG22_10650 [Kiritimatiellia bacterium]|nr:hypothetical protein [Kiritimatiellia bacterium]